MKNTLLLLFTLLSFSTLSAQDVNFEGSSLDPISGEVLSSSVEILISTEDKMSLRAFDSENYLSESIDYTMTSSVLEEAPQGHQIFNYWVEEDEDVVIKVISYGILVPEARGFKASIEIVKEGKTIGDYKGVIMLPPIDKLDGTFKCWRIEDGLEMKDQSFFVKANNEEGLIFYLHNINDTHDKLNLKYVSDGMSHFQSYQKEFDVIDHDVYSSVIVTYFSYKKTNRFADFNIELIQPDGYTSTITARREYKK